MLILKRLPGEDPSTACEKDRYIPPTIIFNPASDSQILRDEVFGPLLPVLTGFKNVEQMVEYVAYGGDNYGGMRRNGGDKNTNGNANATAASAPGSKLTVATKSYIRTRPSLIGVPLALYIFSSDKAETDAIIKSTRSGGVCVNDCIVHMLNETLPFGGCQDSGFGNYHGTWGFKAFSHERAVMQFPADDFPKGRFPPF
jgi:acyl-CoA reductase-like NAD-dependent aldehyde dehydrogenase